MKQAVQAVRKETISYKKVVKAFGVPRSTLKLLVKDTEDSLE